MRYPVVTLMSTIQFEGTFLKRMDALMLAVWFFTLYALLNLHLHYGVRMLKELCANTSSKTQPAAAQAKWWQIVLPTTGVFVIAWIMEWSDTWVWAFLNYYAYLAVPLMVIGPGVLVLSRRKGKEIGK